MRCNDPQRAVQRESFMGGSTSCRSPAPTSQDAGKSATEMGWKRCSASSDWRVGPTSLLELAYRVSCVSRSALVLMCESCRLFMMGDPTKQ